MYIECFHNQECWVSFNNHLTLIVLFIGAFHMATREGFRLQDVKHAPLAKRRKQNNNERSEGSSDSDQSNSSGGSAGSQPSTLSQSVNSLESQELPIDLQNSNLLIAPETIKRKLSDVSSGSNASQNSTVSTGFVPGFGQNNVDLDRSGTFSTTGLGNSEKLCDGSQSSSILIRSSSDESESEIATPVIFTGNSRGTKRIHSLDVNESFCSDSDVEEHLDDLDEDEDENGSDDDDDDCDSDIASDDCIIIDHENTITSIENKNSVSPNKKPRTDTIVID